LPAGLSSAQVCSAMRATLSNINRTLVIANLLAVIACGQTLDDRGGRVLGGGLGMAVHEYRENNVGVRRDQRVILLRLANALDDVEIGVGLLPQWEADVFAVEADDRVGRRGAIVGADRGDVIG